MADVVAHERTQYLCGRQIMSTAYVDELLSQFYLDPYAHAGFLHNVYPWGPHGESAL